MAESSLTQFIEPLILNIQNAFTNQFGRQAEYRGSDLLPGERVASLVIQTFKPNPKYKLRDTRQGVLLWVFEFPVAIATAVDTTGLEPLAAQFKVDGVAAREMFNLPHAIACMKREIESFGIFHDIRVQSVDTGTSVSLDDIDEATGSRNLWIANVTAMVEVWIAVRCDANGEYTTLIG